MSDRSVNHMNFFAPHQLHEHNVHHVHDHFGVNFVWQTDAKRLLSPMLEECIHVLKILSMDYMFIGGERGREEDGVVFSWCVPMLVLRDHRMLWTDSWAVPKNKDSSILCQIRSEHLACRWLQQNSHPKQSQVLRSWHSREQLKQRSGRCRKS